MTWKLGQIMPEAWKALHIHVNKTERIRIKKSTAFRLDEKRRKIEMRKELISK